MTTRSVGSRLLLKICNKYTQLTVAKKVRVSQPTISMWISMKTNPQHHARMQMLIHYGIELNAWESFAEELPELECLQKKH